jgi:glyoxylase-like metal-dependent hydrolase (beta-lactamase superfamily II)
VEKDEPMQIHLLNCGTLCPWISHRLLYGKGSHKTWGQIPCQCLLLELKDRLVLVDTGLGCRDISSPWLRLGALTHLALRPKLDLQETAYHQIQRLGYKVEDVRDVIVTHLDPDHAGGLRDFPWAKVHVHESEFKVAVDQFPTFARYKTQQWAHGCDWIRYSDFGESWEGFRSVKAPIGLKDQILFVPLEGHSPGSMGVAVRTKQNWLFHVGDAIFQRDELDDKPSLSALKLFARQNAFSNSDRAENVQRLRQLHKRGEVRILCSHDESSL